MPSSLAVAAASSPLGPLTLGRSIADAAATAWDPAGRQMSAPIKRF